MRGKLTDRVRLRVRKKDFQKKKKKKAPVLGHRKRRMYGSRARMSSFTVSSSSY